MQNYPLLLPLNNTIPKKIIAENNLLYKDEFVKPQVFLQILPLTINYFNAKIIKL